MSAPMLFTLADFEETEKAAKRMLPWMKAVVGRLQMGINPDESDLLRWCRTGMAVAFEKGAEDEDSSFYS